MRVCSIVLMVATATTPVGLLSGQGGGLGIGAGVVVPGSNYSSHDGAGWQTMVAYTPVGTPSGLFALRVDGLYGQTKRKTGFTGSVASSKVFGLGVNLELHATPRAALMPYVLVGAGYYELEEGNVNGTTAAPTSGAGVSGGVGFAMKFGTVRTFAEGRFIAGLGQGGISFVPVTVGVSIGGW